MNIKKNENIDDKKGKKIKVKRGRKKKKGFTLIELLAVTVILGLLMAIAIPNVSKYITQSRKKTLTSTITNYVNALVAEVNNMEYDFEDSEMIYAIPIECIPLEKGGKNPFGKWYQANDKYWAYVLVQYDEDNLSNKYGFTFKDSSGYGMYPTSKEKLNSKGEQIKVKLSLTKPVSGKITNIADVDKWNGFEVNANTDLVVLEAESEDKKGDGIRTCTLYNKGNNYDEVEEEKENKIIDRTLKTTAYGSTAAFWKYKTKIKTITFEDSINIPADISNDHKWDVSVTDQGKVMAYIIANKDDSTYFDLFIQGDGEIYANPDSSYLFNEFYYVDSINNIGILNTSNVTNMENMFYNTGGNSKVFTLDLGDNFDTSNVTNMSGMFVGTGDDSEVFTLNLGDKFDTSNVTNMNGMFRLTGSKSKKFTLDLGDKFNTSKVTNMSWMFSHAGYSNPNFTLVLGEKFDTSNVTNMSYMFEGLGYSSTNFALDLGDKFNTSKVKNMSYMFENLGYSSTDFTLDLGDKFNTSSVTNMSYMFHNTGYSSNVFTLDLREKFYTNKVTNMEAMFFSVGNNSPIFTLELGDNFDTSNVTDMEDMFMYAGNRSTVFELDLGDKFYTSKVTTMNDMFYNAGGNSNIFKLDLGENFDTSNVTDMYRMFSGAGKDSSVFTLNLGEKFDTKKVTNMRQMFSSVGYSNPNFTLDLGEKFDTSNVTDMYMMFYYTGYNNKNFALNCSKWNVDKVTNHNYFYDGPSTKVEEPIWKN